MIVGAPHIIMVNFRLISKIRGIIISMSVLVSCLMAPVSPVTAHPHMWVDLNSQVVIGNDGKAIAVYQEWLFDDFFSTALIEDAAKHSNGIQAGLTAEVNIILEGLQAYNFFTLLTVRTFSERYGTTRERGAEKYGVVMSVCSMRSSVMYAPAHTKSACPHSTSSYACL